MTNHYAFPPTANQYTEAMGLDKSASGALLAMAPLGSIPTCFLFSWWSNFSFKGPLVAMGTVIVIGDFLYATAYDFDSVAILFAGRFIFGFGRARAPNRRYISDYVAVKDMTKYYSLFVMMATIGFALGPGIASILLQIPEFKLIGLTFNSFTLPGFFFLIVWIVYLFVIISFFEEPDFANSNFKIQQITDRKKAAQGFVEVEGKSGNCWRYWVSITALIELILLKVIQEAQVASAPIVMQRYYEWDATAVSNFFFIVGVLVLPVNYGVAIYSKRMSDYTILMASLILATVGCGMLVNFPQLVTGNENLALIQYLIGSVIAFMGAQVMESVTSSQLAKALPAVVAASAFNSGFLNTQAGLVGRIIGSSSTSLAGGYEGRYIENGSFFPLFSVSLVLLLLSACTKKAIDKASS
jgi:hypothetical protein